MSADKIDLDLIFDFLELIFKLVVGDERFVDLALDDLTASRLIVVRWLRRANKGYFGGCDMLLRARGLQNILRHAFIYNDDFFDDGGCWRLSDDILKILLFEFVRKCRCSDFWVIVVLGRHFHWSCSQLPHD